MSNYRATNFVLKNLDNNIKKFTLIFKELWNQEKEKIKEKEEKKKKPNTIKIDIPDSDNSPIFYFDDEEENIVVEQLWSLKALIQAFSFLVQKSQKVRRVHVASL